MKNLKTDLYTYILHTSLVHQDALQNKVIGLKASYQIKIQSFQFLGEYTLISPRNVESRLLILKKISALHAHFHPPRLLIS